jgi:hypothetical protein
MLNGSEDPSTLAYFEATLRLFTSISFSSNSRRAGNFNLLVAIMAIHKSPDVAESKPESTVSVRGDINFSDQPAMPVEKLQISNSLARSVVDTRPRR